MDFSHHRAGAYDVLEQSLRDILLLLEPSARDREIRLNTFEKLTTCLRSVNALRGAAVKPFGSFVSNLYSKGGDLDISVQFDNSLMESNKSRKRSLLKEIMRTLRKEGVAYEIEFIPNARVPLLKFKSTYNSISCDISIDNYSGLFKSKMLLWISEIDDRFRDMVLLIKEWAKAKDINDPKSGTFNSYSLCLLIIFHFQTCVPAILPPLKEIYEGNLSVDITGIRFISERNLEDTCTANIRRFKSQNLGKKNYSSLSELLISFFQKIIRWNDIKLEVLFIVNEECINGLRSLFSNIRNRSLEYAICTHTGQWERLYSSPRWRLGSHHILVEDPFEQEENAARSVSWSQLFKISDVFQEAYHRFSSVDILSNRDSLLACLTRPSTSLQLHSGTYGGNSRQLAEHGITPTLSALSRFQDVLRLDGHSPTSSTGSHHRNADSPQGSWRPQLPSRNFQV